jgi:F0F1-type ATP synthase assembly protein I
MESQPRSPLRYTTIGTEFTVTVGLLAGGGLWLDRRIDTTPAFTLVGLVLGFAVGMVRLIRQARQAQRDVDADRKDRPGQA